MNRKWKSIHGTNNTYKQISSYLISIFVDWIETCVCLRSRNRAPPWYIVLLFISVYILFSVYVNLIGECLFPLLFQFVCFDWYIFKHFFPLFRFIPFAHVILWENLFNFEKIEKEKWAHFFLFVPNRINSARFNKKKIWERRKRKKNEKQSFEKSNKLIRFRERELLCIVKKTHFEWKYKLIIVCQSKIKKQSRSLLYTSDFN